MAHGPSLLSIVALVAGIAVLAALRKKRNAHAHSPGYTPAWPVYARPVMSKVERDLFRRLIEAFPEKLVLPQVQLCRFVEVQNVRGRNSVLNRYSRLSADFIICNEDAEVERVVELDDRSHYREAARIRDAKKNAVLNAAGIPIVRFQANAIPSAEDLRRLLLGEQSSVVVTQGRQHDAKVEPTISMP